MATKDILQEIPNDKLPELLPIYKQNWPLAIHVYYFIDATIKLKQKRPNENYIQIYCPNGDFSDGTIVAIIQMYCYDVLICTMDKTQKRLEQALRETKIIDYSKSPLFCAMIMDFYDMVSKVRNEIGQPFPCDVPSNVWWIPKDKAIQYEYTIPDDMYVAPLQESHAIIITEIWPHRGPGSEKYLAKLIDLYGAIGLFSKSTNELCAWVLKNYFGGLGMLQVVDKCKRRGFGSLVSKIFSKKIASEDGYDIIGFIVLINAPSQNMFTKLGFQKATPVTWLENKKYDLHFE